MSFVELDIESEEDPSKSEQNQNQTDQNQTVDQTLNNSMELQDPEEKKDGNS